MSVVKRAFALNTASTALSFFIQLGSAVAISRLLTPAEIGVYSVALAAIALLAVLREFGASTYVLQKRDLTAEILRSVIGVVTLMSWSIGALLFLLSPAIARFYGQPEMSAVIRVISANYIFVPFLGIVTSMLGRNLQFGRRITIGLSNSAVSAAIGIGFAALGHGAISLAYASIGGTVIAVILAVLFRPAELPWRPGLKHWREITAFGAKVVYNNAVSEVGASAPDLVIGHMLGMAPVAMLSRATAIRKLVVSHLLGIVNSTFIPVFAAELRDNQNLRHKFSDRNEIVSVLYLSTYALTIPLSGPLIMLFFGPQWMPAVPIAQILCGLSLLGTPMSLVNAMLTAKGAVGALARVNTVLLVVRIVAVVIGGNFGLIWVAWFMAAEAIVYIFLGHKNVQHHFGMSAITIYRQSWKSWVVAAVVGLLTWLGVRLAPDYALGEFEAFIACAAGGVLGLGGALSASLALNHGLNREIIAMLRKWKEGRR